MKKTLGEAIALAKARRERGESPWQLAGLAAKPPIQKKEDELAKELSSENVLCLTDEDLSE